MSPDYFSQRFDDRLASDAASLGVALDAAQRGRLLRYLGLIQRWTAVYNLTAVRDVEGMYVQHLLDCLAIVSPLRRHAATHAVRRILDVGSGAGLPGAVLAIVEPGWRVTCIDAVAKKATFLRQVAAELGLPNLQGVHGRVEDARVFAKDGFDLVVSRAFASLQDFTSWTRARLAIGGHWAAMKGHLTEDERTALSASVDVFHVEPLRVPHLDAARCLVWMTPTPP